MNHHLTCVVVDDEPEIRAHVARLAAASGLEVVGEAADGEAALSLVRQLRPAVLFVDIRMPSLSGLGLVDLLRAEAEPPVAVLVTAYEEHALAAFELAAADYVVKPIDRVRFAVAAARAVEWARGRQAAAALQRLESVLSRSRPEVLSFREGADIVSLMPADVVRFEAMDDYVEARTKERAFLLSARLGALAALLPSPPFLHVHRSHLVNVDHVRRMATRGGRITLAMHDGAIVPVSRARAVETKQALAGALSMGNMEDATPGRDLSRPAPYRSEA